MDSSQEGTSSAQIQVLAQQVAQEQALLQQLLVAQGAQTQPPLELHDLPTRPRYDWQPSQPLFELMPILEHPIFSVPLPDDDRKTIVDRYPPVAGVNYSPPATLPAAERHFKL